MVRLKPTSATFVMALWIGVCAAQSTAPEVRLLEAPSGPGAAQPALSVGPDGSVHLTWQAPVETDTALLWSRFQDTAWTAPESISQGKDFFVNWADFPSLVGLEDGSLLAHWLVRSSAAPYAYDIHTSRTRDGGKSWSPPSLLHRDGTQSEHGFVSLVPLEGGRAAAIWLDGREMSGHGKAGAMTLRFAVLEANGDLSDERVLDRRVCDCCQTSAVRTPAGIVVAYRDRSDDEIRDISLLRQSDAGWTEPFQPAVDGWMIPGCPVNGPRLASSGQTVAMTWFTLGGGRPRVRLILSRDGGISWGDPLRVDRGRALGRVDIAVTEEGGALVSWLEQSSPERAEIRLKRFHPDGQPLWDLLVADTSPARSSGFPRFALISGSLFIAWTEVGEPSRLRTARLEIGG